MVTSTQQATAEYSMQLTLKTGNIDFTYGNNLTDPNNSTRTPETVYGEYPTQVAAIANNKVYLVEEEHSLERTSIPRRQNTMR